MNGKRAKCALMVVVLVMFFAPPRAHGGSNVFKEQLIDFADKTAGLLTKVEGRKHSYTAQEQLDFVTDNLAVVTLIHRLQETAQETNNRELEKSGKLNRELLLVSQGCIAVEFVRISIANYVQTGDRAFLVLARDAAGLVQSIRKQFFR